MQTLLITRLIRSMWRTKLRVSVLLLLIITATYTTVLMAEFNENATQVYDDFYYETNLADMVVTTGGVMVEASNLTDTCTEMNATREGEEPVIKDCETRIRLEGSFMKKLENGSTKPILATYYGMDTDDMRGEISSIWLVEGRMAEAIDEVVLDTHVYTEQGVNIGDTVELGIPGASGLSEYRVVGLANSPHHIFFVGNEGTMFPTEGTYAVIYMPSRSLAMAAGIDLNSRNLMLIDVEGEPNYDFESTIEDEGPELTAMKHRLSSVLVKFGVEDAMVGDRGSIMSVELLRQDLEGSVKSTPYVLILLAAISGIVIAISMERLVKSQDKEIAVLRTLGFRSSDIRNNYLLLPLFLGGIGATIGAAWATSPFWGSAWMTEWYFAMWGCPVVRVNHYPSLVFVYWLSTIFLVFLFGMRPAFKASRLMPLDVMGQQHETSLSPRLARITSKLPTTIGLGIRSTFRKPRRLAVTILALGISTMVMGGSMMMFSSMTDYIMGSMEENEKWDAQVIFYPWQRGEVETWVEDNSVEAEWYFITEGNATGDPRSFVVYGLDEMADVADGNGALHLTPLIDGRLPVANSSITEVVVDMGTAEFLEWSLDEIVSIQIGGIGAEVRVVGTSNELTRSVWMYRSDLSALIGGVEANGAYLKGDGVDWDDLSAIAIATEKTVMVEALDATFDKFGEMIWIYLLMGGLIAVAVLYNTLLINLAERDTELSTLRVLGASSGGLWKLLLVEHAIIGTIGGAIGALSSYVTAKGLITAFVTWSWYFNLEIDWPSAGKMFAFILIASLLTTPIGVSRIRKMDLVEKVKEYSS